MKGALKGSWLELKTRDKKNMYCSKIFNYFLLLLRLDKNISLNVRNEDNAQKIWSQILPTYFKAGKHKTNSRV